MCCWKCVCSSFTYLVYHSVDCLQYSESNIHTGWKGLGLRLLLYRSLGASIPGFQKRVPALTKWWWSWSAISLVQNLIHRSETWFVARFVARFIVRFKVWFVAWFVPQFFAQFTGQLEFTMLAHKSVAGPAQLCPHTSGRQGKPYTTNANDTLLYNTHA